MGKCDVCGATILFGGVGDGELHFCSKDCCHRGYPVPIAGQLPDDLVTEHTQAVHQGACPRCNGPGPVDVHYSYTVWSALLLTSWKGIPRVCCGRCGAKSKIRGALSSGLLGWWGFPWGLLMTAVQIGRNLCALAASRDPCRPSDELATLVRTMLAVHAAEVCQQDAADGD